MLSRKAGKDTGNRINVMCINYRDKSSLKSCIILIGYIYGNKIKLDSLPFPIFKN